MTKSIPHQERAAFRSGRTPEFYRKFIAGFPTSGMSLSDYCRMHHVGQNSFRKYTEPQTLSHRQAPKLHRAPKLVRLVSKTEPVFSSSPIEILLPGGVLIRIAHLNEKVLLTLRPILYPSIVQ